MHLLVLYTRLPVYFLKCLEHWVSEKKGRRCEILVLSEDNSAPYNLSFSDDIKLSNFHVFDKADLEVLNPDVIYVAGWANKEYLKLCRHYKTEGIPIICGLDNPWKSSLVQILKTKLFKHYIKKYFDYLWVAGNSQTIFANKLGFSKGEILNNLYVGNFEDYTVSKDLIKEKESTYNRSLIYFGRLVPYKNVINLISAFNNLDDKERNGWTLKIVGSGLLEREIEKMLTENIELHPFTQPDHLAEIVKNCGAYILPSISENWGVALHEATIAGLPILSSVGVHSASRFLKDETNGFLFEPTTNGIKQALIKLFSKNSSELVEMGIYSHKLSNKVNYVNWSNSINSVLNSSTDRQS
jgi:glycosyltransferase involved in cell wall biosynthesis